MEKREVMKLCHTTVNVIVPVFNVEQFLPQCIESLITQSYGFIRIWLVDDGSTDRCSTLCDEYGGRDSRVVVIHKVNGGQASARNAALDAIFALLEDERGEYVSFVDSDDWVESDYIEFLLDLAEKTGADVSQCGHWVTYSGLREVEKNRKHDLHIFGKREALESVLRNGVCDVTSWNKLYRLEVFKELRFPVGSYYEDTAIAPLLICQAGIIAVNMEPKYHYRQRYNSTANGTAWTDKKYDFVAVGDDIAQFAINCYSDLAAAAIEKRVFVRLSTLAQMVNTGHSDTEKIREMRRFILDNAPTLMVDSGASKRDKLGVVAIALGYPFFRLIWSVCYAIKRRKG